jgi:nucleotidyltransferase AbiEii toxin of type IV toxin-antitoxin system
MDKLARLSAKDRRDIFAEAAARRGIRPTVIEKDFWVCIVLKLLFHRSRFKESLVFKGGTSLSKAYGLIERFSEDIDLVLDWNVIGFGEGLRDPLQDFDSKSKQDRFNKEINNLAAMYIAQTLCPELNDLLQQEEIGLSAAVDSDDPHSIGIRYPAAFSEAYIRPEVRLEIGPLASWVPSATRVIRPYAFEVLPEVFENPECRVIAIAAERTFWEKATILHQEAHRTTQIPQRYSRHYYDLYNLAASSIRATALASPKILEDVVAFKRRFYPSAWARYDLAVLGSLQLLPTAASRITDLERDYADMQVMLFRESPPFGTILDELKALENEINSKVANPNPHDR